MGSTPFGGWVLVGSSNRGAIVSEASGYRRRRWGVLVKFSREGSNSKGFQIRDQIGFVKLFAHWGFEKSGHIANFVYCIPK